MHLLKTTVGVLCAAAMAQSAHADVLWDQSDVDPLGAGFFNSESGEPPFGITMFTVSDIVVEGDGWTVDKITTFYSALDQEWGLSITQAYLSVFSKVGPLPEGSDDPTMSPLVSVSATLDADTWKLCAEGLDLLLAPGEYWIGVTPIAGSGTFGPELHLSSGTQIDDASPSYDPFGIPVPGWLNFTPDTDASILIEGTIVDPVPTIERSWGLVKRDFR